MGIIKNLTYGLLEVAYPKICHVCKKKIKEPAVSEFVCTECWKKIKINPPPFCYRCGRSLAGRKCIRNICTECIKKPLHFDRAFSPCTYDGVIKELIHVFKYEKKDYLGIFLSRFMVEFIKDYNVPMHIIDAIIPVPLHKIKLREKEFNHAHILSQHLGAEFNTPVSSEKLLRIRNTKTQTELTCTERFLNVKGCFSANERDPVKDLNILLVDDVLTTAATSSEAALALKTAGANIVLVLTVAN